MIITVENPHDDHLLHTPCKKVKKEDFQSIELLILKQEMKRIALDPGAAGVAAPQLGKSIRIFVLCTKLIPEPFFFFNPVLKGVSEEIKIVEEGCLSVPGKVVKLQRYEKIKISWQDEFGKTYAKDNKKYEFEFEGFESQAVQHELDHLNGVLCSDIAKAVYNASDFEESFAKAKEAEEALALEG